MRYTREDACRAWLTYASTNADTLNWLMEKYRSAEVIYDKLNRIGCMFLIDKVSRYGIVELDDRSAKDKMHEMLMTMQRLDIGIIGQDSDRYPEVLRQMQSPPALLFYRGNLDCAAGKCVSVVGSRDASPQGVEATRKICCDLSMAGVTIVSGLARGIDAAAHEGCLEGGSPTIAVLGCGLDVDYPRENADLKECIVESGGLLLSEYPPGIKANKYVFRARNRIISGLGKALLLMECRIQSGSMLTVQHALDQGKDVYAYPGIPGTECSEGPQQLLREGATFFTSAKEVLEDLGWDSDIPKLSAQRKELPPMDPDQQKVYALLSRGAMSFDQLYNESGLETSALLVALTMLEMTKRIKTLPGKSYSLS